MFIGYVFKQFNNEKLQQLVAEIVDVNETLGKNYYHSETRANRSFSPLIRLIPPPNCSEWGHGDFRKY